MTSRNLASHWLDIPPTIHGQVWQWSQAIPIPGHRFNAYLNQVCLLTVLPWLQEQVQHPERIGSRSVQSQLHRWIDGSAVDWGESRIILIPTEAMDQSELRVPQEWIDIPEWTGDYYLLIEVDTDEQWLSFRGFTTHLQLKTCGDFDAIDRTYSLPQSDLIQEMNVLWVMQQLAQEPTQGVISPLPVLAETETQHLLTRLQNPNVNNPRLELPFFQWGALLGQERSLQALQERYELSVRHIAGETGKMFPTHLSQWFQNTFEAGWQTLEEIFGSTPSVAHSFRRGHPADTVIQRLKPLHLGTASTVILSVLAGVESHPTDEKIEVRAQVLPWLGESFVPSGLELSLLSTTGEILQAVYARAEDNYIQLKRFRCPPGTQFQVKVAIADHAVTEDFVV
jgi:hypothetical protein